VLVQQPNAYYICTKMFCVCEVQAVVTVLLVVLLFHFFEYFFYINMQIRKYRLIIGYIS